MTDPPVGIAYDPEQWHDLYVALAGAAAALTGLLFVAVSINLKQILEERLLPRRAAETLSIMVGLLVLSVFMLVPGQPRWMLGLQILAIGLAEIVAIVGRLRVPPKPDEPAIWRDYPAVLLAAFDLPLILGGVSVLAGVGGGFYWLVAAIVLGLLAAVLNAWVLLVEILR